MRKTNQNQTQTRRATFNSEEEALTPRGRSRLALGFQLQGNSLSLEKIGRGFCVAIDGAVFQHVLSKYEHVLLWDIEMLCWGFRWPCWKRGALWGAMLGCLLVVSD